MWEALEAQRDRNSRASVSPNKFLELNRSELSRTCTNTFLQDDEAADRGLNLAKRCVLENRKVRQRWCCGSSRPATGDFVYMWACPTSVSNELYSRMLLKVAPGYAIL